jgi:K+-transporting ATPase ATPase A chain
MFIALLHPFLIWLNCFAEVIYTHQIQKHYLVGWPILVIMDLVKCYTNSSSANNGSGFEGLGDNTPFWNIATGIVMLLRDIYQSSDQLLLLEC